MKKLTIIILILISTISHAQRKRITATFDSDTTRPTIGSYGITVIKDQPYLVGSKGYAQRIETSPLFIKGISYGTSNKSVTLDTIHNHHWITGDSVNITFPPKTQFTNKKQTWQYYLRLLGYRGGTDSTKKYTPFDNTFRYTFSDTIFYYNEANKTTYFTKVLSHNATQSFWKITGPKAVYLELRENRWYLFFANIKF